MKVRIIILMVLTVAFISCKKNTNPSKVPVVKFLSQGPDTVATGSAFDSVYISFQVNDGDGDLGDPGSTSTGSAIYLLDSRTAGSAAVPYPFPPGLSSAINPVYGAEAVVTVQVSAKFLTLRPDHPKGDTLTYDLYVKDAAGNESNHITTPKIYITP